MFQADDSHTTIENETPSGGLTSAHGRQLLEQAVECLIAFIDMLDPDRDLEDNGDAEPSLGWPIPQEMLGQRLNTDADCRGDFGDDREHDTADDEPSLGWQNEGSQGRLHVSNDDCEEQCEDEGAEHDGPRD
jgi:hypothetical protein